MVITKGKIEGAQKTILYAPEGYGKSTFASKYPDPVFIDTEGSTKQLDVARFDGDMTKWENILDAVDYVIDNPDCCKTLVIDTADWAEQACIKYTVERGGSNIKGIEDFGYGKGYIYALENFQKLLVKLDKVIEKGIHVMITAHAQMRKFEQPDEMGAYDRWEMKLSKKIAPVLKEWADIVLFGNYKTYVVEDSKTKSKKASGNKRVLYTTHHACWDAKNRHGLDPELPFEYESIKSIYEGKNNKTIEKSVGSDHEKNNDDKSSKTADRKADFGGKNMNRYEDIMKSDVPENLRDLMLKHDVTEWDIQMAVSSIKNSKYDTTVPISKYDPDFIQHMLVDKFDGMLKKIAKLEEELPYFMGGKDTIK